MQGAVWSCVVTEFSVQCVRVHGKASEMYQRYIGKAWRLIAQGCTLTQSQHLYHNHICTLFCLIPSSTPSAQPSPSTHTGPSGLKSTFPPVGTQFMCPPPLCFTDFLSIFVQLHTYMWSPFVTTSSPQIWKEGLREPELAQLLGWALSHWVSSSDSWKVHGGIDDEIQAKGRKFP